MNYFSHMRIIAIRHGEIPLNAQDRLTGWIDQDLTPAGRDQALRLADSLQQGFEVLFASPLLRTVSTAAILAAKYPCKIVLDPNLRERNFGSLNGKTWAEVEAETGQDLRHQDIDLMNYDYRPYAGESVAQVTARARAFIRSATACGATACGATGDVAAVTHGGIIKILYSLLPSDHRQPISNCSIHIFHL